MSGTRGVGTMNESEVTNFIKDHPVGVLTLVDGDKPYSVVLEHYFDGQSLYFGSSTREDQRKIKVLFAYGWYSLHSSIN